MKYNSIIEKIGLSKDEASVYEALLTLGPSPASKLAKETGLSRPLVYKILENLFQKRIVDRDDSQKVIRFYPAHPSKLLNLVESQKKDIESAENSLQGIIGNLTSQYNLFSGKPNMVFYEGFDGIKHLYHDILFEKKDILLFRSPDDNELQEIENLIKRQIKNQVELGIKTRAITPLKKEHMSGPFPYDKENLVTRSIVSMEDLSIPAQIVIYGEKVAITSFKNSLITTIIQDKAINETFRILFEFIWKKGIIE